MATCEANPRLTDALNGISCLCDGSWPGPSPGLPRPVSAITIFHPAYLLRTPDAKRDAWRDLLLVKKRVDGQRH